nr:hypothetical protein [Tanacetum cinerariifolium]
RLLASFQDDAKYEHGGQDTRLQGGIDDQDKKDKDLKISTEKTKSKDNHNGERSKIVKHEGPSLQRLDRSNEMIANHLQEYEQATTKLSIGEKIELINELKEQREFYMSVLRSHAGWKTRHFRGMTLEEIKEKFIPVWKQFEDFVTMSSKEERERVKRNGMKLDKGSAKKMKTSEDVSKEDLKGMMKLVPVEEVYVEALQVKHPIIDWEIHSEDLHQLWALVKETLSIRQATKDKEKELWVELKRLFEPDSKDQLWTHTNNLKQDPLDWKLYDTCGVHHVSSKDQKIFMQVKRDYLLRRGLAIVMICNKLQAFPLPVMKIPRLEYFATISAKEFPLLSCSVAHAEVFALLDEDNDYSQSKTHLSQSKTCVSYS